VNISSTYIAYFEFVIHLFFIFKLKTISNPIAEEMNQSCLTRHLCQLFVGRLLDRLVTCYVVLLFYNGITEEFYIMTRFTMLSLNQVWDGVNYIYSGAPLLAV